MAISIYRGTTPTLRCILPTEMTKDNIHEIWLTFKNIDKIKMRFDQIDYYYTSGDLQIEGNIVTLAFTQAMTLRFKPVDYKLDIRVLLKNGSALALQTKKIVRITDVLHDGIIGPDLIQNRIIPLVLSDADNMEFKVVLNSAQQTFDARFDTQTVIGGTTDYNELENKPQINGVTLEGDKSFADLHFYSLQPDQIQDIWDEL